MDAVQVIGLSALTEAPSKPLQLELTMSAGGELYHAAIVAEEGGWALHLRDGEHTLLPRSGDHFPSQESAIVCAMLQCLDFRRSEA